MEIADQIVARFADAKARRIESEEMALKHGDWANPEAGQRCLELVRSLHAYVSTDKAVHAVVNDNRDGRIWGYAAAEALDYAASEFNLDNAEIIEHSPTRYTLVWS